MVCIYCGHKKTQVKNSRSQKRTNTTWRRRSCESCNNIFSTIESINLAQALRYELKSGKLMPFDRDVLFVDVYKCLKHRQSLISDATNITSTIISKLIAQKIPIITRNAIITTCQTVFNNFDKTAAVQYAAFHKPS